VVLPSKKISVVVKGDLFKDKSLSYIYVILISGHGRFFSLTTATVCMIISG